MEECSTLTEHENKHDLILFRKRVPGDRKGQDCVRAPTRMQRLLRPCPSAHSNRSHFCQNVSCGHSRAVCMQLYKTTDLENLPLSL